MTHWIVTAGTLLGLFGCCAIALYTWMNGRARSRGSDAHWRTGVLVGTPGMFAMFAGWILLALAEPRVSSVGLSMLGVVFLVAGAAVYVASARWVGRWRTPATYRPALHTSGLYAHVRHPQALALCLLAAGGALASGSVPFLLTLPVWVGFWIGYTFLEEWNELLPAFGGQYQRYRRTTPRLLPRIPAALGRRTRRASGAP